MSGDCMSLTLFLAVYGNLIFTEVSHFSSDSVQLGAILSFCSYFSRQHEKLLSSGADSWTFINFLPSILFFTSVT